MTTGLTPRAVPSDAYLAAILQASNEAIVGYTPDGTISAWNPAAERVFGYSSDEALGQSISLLAPPDCEQEPWDLLRRIMAGGSVVRRTTFRARKDRSLVPVVVSLSPIRSSNGAIVAISANYEDLSERNRAHADVHAAHSQLEQLLDSMNDGFLLLDREWRITYYNEAARRAVGTFAENTLGRILWEVHPDVLGTSLERNYRRAMAERVPVEFETFYAPWNRWFALRAFPHRNGGLAVLFQDITARKRSEAIADGEKRVLQMLAEGGSLRQALEHMIGVIEGHTGHGAMASVLLLDPDGVHLRPVAGPRVPAGYTDAINPCTIGPTDGCCGAAIARKSTVIVADIAKDPLWAEHGAKAVSQGLRACWSTPVFASTGRPLGTIAVYYPEPRAPLARDMEMLQRVAHTVCLVVERKQAEQALAGALQTLEGIFAHAQVGLSLSDVHGSLLQVNPAFATIFGYPANELLGRTFDSLLPAETRASARSVYAARLRGELQSGLEWAIVRPDGTCASIQVQARKVTSPAGEIQVLACVTDISDLKATEAALRQSEERLQLAQQAAHIATWEWNGRRSEITWSKGIFDLLGLPAGELERSLERWLAFIHPEDRLEVARQLRQIREKHADFTLEFRICRSDGAVRWLAAMGRVEGSKPGTALCLRGVVLDVTERKHAEDALRENEARQRSILEHLPVGVWFVDAAANLLYANPAGSKIWGGDRFVHSNEYNNYRGKWHDTSKPLTPDDWAGARALKKGETSLRELIDIECFDGRQKTILNSAVPVRGKAGEITGAVIFNEDVSDLVAAQRALLESEQEFKAFFELSSVGAAEVDPVTNCFTRVNRKFCEITGYSEAELLKLGPLALTAPEEREKDVAQGKRLFSRETNDWQSEKRYLRKDGTLIWVQVTGTVLRRADGVPQRFLAVIQDITSRRQSQELMRSEAKRMEKLVEARTAKLQETVAELEAFAYSISHDLRAPLRALNSFSEALQQDYAEKLDDTAKHYLRRMGAACQRMDKLILDVLAYSRIVRQEIVLEPVDLHKLVRGLLDSFPHLQASQADIQIEGTLPQVVSSETALTQCISNLLGNAVKFVPAGTKPVVRIWSETREDGLYLLVRDNGIGIAPENEKRIFQLFQQLNKGYDGTGIGLSIVRKAIERLGGSVGVQSQPGKGSCFWLKLPLKDPAADGLDFSEKPALGI